MAKRNSMVDIALLEWCLREDLNRRAPRVMAVLRPLKVVIENYPAGKVEQLEAANHPQKSVLESYKKEYEAAYGEDVCTFGGHAYDALTLVVAAIEAQGATRDQIRDGLESLANIVGTAGVFTFSAEDHNGLSLDALIMLTVKDGKFVPYKK